MSGGWKYTIEHNYGLHNVVGSDGKAKARLVASCHHRVDAERIMDLYASLACETCGGDRTVPIEEGEPGVIVATMPCPDCAVS